MSAKSIFTPSEPQFTIEDSTLRARWAIDDLLSSDGHRLSLVFSCSLRILPEAAEQKFFRETFLSDSAAIKPEQILAHFRPSLQSAAAVLAQEGSVATALDPPAKPRWIDALRAAAEAVAFSCGIGLLPPFSLELSSPSLHQERLEQQHRAATLRTNTERAEQFQRAGQLLRQWESLKASSPSLAPGRVLEQMSPTDRGPMLETLLMGSAEQADQPNLWAVAGSSLVRVSLNADAIKPELISLPATAGPLRSVQWSENRLMVGAQKGVVLHEAQTLENPTVYLDPELSSEHGFTSVTLANDGIWASHREAGIVFWTLGQTDRPSYALRAAELKESAKHSIAIPNSSELLFAVGSNLMKVATGGKPSTVATLPAPIVSILIAADRAIVVAEDGAVAIFDLRTLKKTADLRPVSESTGAALLPWLGTVRILLTTRDGPIHCVGLDDQLITHYSGPHLGMRAVAGSIGKIAAMSADRQRVILWNTWDGRRPSDEIHLTSLTRHRISDIAFG
jgi:hypothetical protein